MSTIKRSFRKRYEWHAWSGEMADLGRLGKLVEELHEVRLRELESEARQRIEINSDSEIQSIQVQGTLNYFQYGPGDGEVYPFVGVVVVDEDEVAGPILDVLPEVDRRSVESLRFVAALSASERLSVTFVRDASEAVVIDVVSQRTGWAKQAFARLADEIEKGVPRWAALRSDGPRFGLSVTAAVVIGLFFGLVLPKSTAWNERLAVGTVVFVATWPLVLMNRLHKWLFPGFELLGEGGQSSGTRRLVTLALLVASIPIGVLVNAIS
ncbi:hypothetical protein ACQP0I_25595 [Micromonospora carbonacea]|uniref:hypothetical protein n=1 Tax=Micromonospora carbonacea TaxID=47853 RepID=UPI003D967875